MSWAIRTAGPGDLAGLKELIGRSALELQREVYSEAQIRAALGPVFGVDEQMVEDGTYFVVESGGRLVGCGGWSFREALFGGRVGGGEVPRLDPDLEAARVRAFFVEPAFARRGIGSCLMEACERGIVAAGFRRGEISATLVGEPLYEKFGYRTTERYEIELEGVASLSVVRMVKDYL